MQQQFTGTEYVKIAIANAYGLDKELFETRLEWVNSMVNMNMLTDDTLLNSNVDKAKEPALFLSGVFALKDAIAGNPSGFMLGMDACSSGIQIMGALIACPVTCENTGLVNPKVRANIYKDVTVAMNKELAKLNITVAPDQKEIKLAVMTHFYGSKEQPKIIFGEDTIELETFYKCLVRIAPGATTVMEHLGNAWQPYALEHKWTLPDGFTAVVPVMEKVDFKVEVDELDHATFTHRILENQGTEHGLSIAANVTHSVDGMVVREMNRRCNYDLVELSTCAMDLKRYLGDILDNTLPDHSDFVSLVMVTKIIHGDIELDDISDGKLVALYNIILDTLDHKSFPIVCVHDEFKSAPNNMNRLRQNYATIIAELSMSNLLSDILAQIHNVPTYQITKLGNVSNSIRNSNYGLS
jgi:hypothetical protein